MEVSQPLASTGDRLRILRETAELSQEQLAEKLEVHQTAVSAWECGRSIPAPDVALRLAEFFEVTLDHIYGRESAA